MSLKKNLKDFFDLCKRLIVNNFGLKCIALVLAIATYTALEPQTESVKEKKSSENKDFKIRIF